MKNDKRQCTRYNIPIIMQFHSPKETAEYSWGLIRNISADGFSFESLNFDPMPSENLELKLKFPQKNESLSVRGEVIWKKQLENRWLTGIKIGKLNEKDKNEYLEKISAHGNIPVSWFSYNTAPEAATKRLCEEKSGLKIGTDNAVLEKIPKKDEQPGPKKQYFDESKACRVSFRLPKNAALSARKVSVVGDFNGWDKEATLMKRLVNGDFAVTIDLQPGIEYRYRYLIDDIRWENDCHADKYMPNAFGGEDSVVIV